MKKLALIFAIALFTLLSVLPTFAKKNNETIVDIASSNPDFSVLTSLVVDLGYADALSGNRPFTVFAPTDQAFTDLIAFLVDNGFYPDADAVLQDTDTLNTILAYHVVPGRRYSTSVLNANRMRTLGGEFLSADGISFADLSLIDIKASNGVIHVIDTVLVPPSVLAALGL